jgi:hypothetical protein
MYIMCTERDFFCIIIPKKRYLLLSIWLMVPAGVQHEVGSVIFSFISFDFAK